MHMLLIYVAPKFFFLERQHYVQVIPTEYCAVTVISANTLCNDNAINRITRYFGMILTHWGQDKMDAILQMTFPSAFSCMKMFEFRFEFHWSVCLRVQSTIFQHWCRLWLGADQATIHYLNQWSLYYRRIFASFSLNELTWAARCVLPGTRLHRLFLNIVYITLTSPERHSVYNQR